MMSSQKEKKVLGWIERISGSSLGVEEYFSRYNVPFDIAQYYRYKKKLADGGIDAIKDRRSRGNNRKLTEEAAGFLKGYMTSYPTAGFIAVLHT